MLLVWLNCLLAPSCCLEQLTCHVGELWQVRDHPLMQAWRSHSRKDSQAAHIIPVKPSSSTSHRTPRPQYTASTFALIPTSLRTAARPFTLEAASRASAELATAQKIPWQRFASGVRQLCKRATPPIQPSAISQYLQISRGSQFLRCRRQVSL